MKKLRALLIDPFQRRVHELAVSKDLSEWHKLLDCDFMDRVAIGLVNNQPVDIWVNESGLVTEPFYPIWNWVGIPRIYPNPICGYGLMLSHDAGGESTPTDLRAEFVMAQVVFEPWEGRLDPETYFDQLTRIYFTTGT